MTVTKQRVRAYNRHIDFSDGMEPPGIDMSSLAASNERTLAAPAKIIQPAWVRIVHWINAVAMLMMIMSGIQMAGPNLTPLTCEQGLFRLGMRYYLEPKWAAARATRDHRQIG